MTLPWEVAPPKYPPIAFKDEKQDLPVTFSDPNSQQLPTSRLSFIAIAGLNSLRTLTSKVHVTL